VVIAIANALGDDDRAFIIGGQAFNLWAEYYARNVHDLNDFGPFASKDFDYFGERDVAEKLASILGGALIIPDRDETLFHTAIVSADMDGMRVDVDFLTHVLGVRRGLKDGVVELAIPFKINGKDGAVSVRIMHPLHCLQSRIANIVKLGRVDEMSKRQAAAAPIIVREFIAQGLEEGDERGAIDTLKGLFDYLHKDIYGRTAHQHLRSDPLDVLRHFRNDTRLDHRFREHSLASMINQLEKRR
jgi:hypothetical protein